jgi:hypothetical protein
MKRWAMRNVSSQHPEHQADAGDIDRTPVPGD